MYKRQDLYTDHCSDHAGIDLEILKGRQEKEITVFGRDFNEYAGALFVWQRKYRMVLHGISDGLHFYLWQQK